jgi:hypothetical protein
LLYPKLSWLICRLTIAFSNDFSELKSLCPLLCRSACRLLCREEGAFSVAEAALSVAFTGVKKPPWYLHCPLLHWLINRPTVAFSGEKKSLCPSLPQKDNAALSAAGSVALSLSLNRSCHFTGCCVFSVGHFVASSQGMTPLCRLLDALSVALSAALSVTLPFYRMCVDFSVGCSVALSQDMTPTT